MAIDPAGPPREMPYLRNAILLAGFLIVTVIAVVTVLLPELEDEPEEQAQQAEADPATEGQDTESGNSTSRD